MLTVRQAAVKCQLDPSTIAKAVESGKIPSKKIKIGPHPPAHIMQESDVDKWYQARPRTKKNKSAKLSMYQAQELSGLSYSVVQKAVRDGELSAIQIPDKSRFKWQLDKAEVMEWAETKVRKNRKNPDVVKEKKCRLKPGTKVKYKSDEESRNNDHKVGTIERIYDRFVLIVNENGYRECFSHFDYRQGAFKRA